MNERPRLPLDVQVGYATAEIGINTVETVLRLYVLAYYIDVVGLEARLAGVAASIAIVWDALIDPIMGVISDRTRHRFGGRRGYLPLGGVLLALGIASVFWPPALDGQAAKFGWLLLSYCFLNTGLTVLTVPYTAMAGEMTEDPHARAVLFGWRFGFSNFGALAAAGLPFLFLSPGAGSASVMPQVSIVAAALVVATSLWSWVATRRIRFASLPLLRGSFASAFKAPFGNATFRPLLAAYVVANTGIGINNATFLFYYQHHLRLPAEQTQGVLVVFLLVFTLSLFGWVQLARHYGKRMPLVVGAVVLGFGTPALYLLVPPGSFLVVMWLGAIGLGSFVGCIVLIDAMLTDVLDHDLVRTRQLRSGLFFGLWKFASKMARAVSVATVGLVLGFVGLKEGQQEQPPEVGTALVWLFGPGVGAFFLLAAWILWRYRFDEQKHAQVRRILERRRAR